MAESYKGIFRLGCDYCDILDLQERHAAKREEKAEKAVREPSMLLYIL
jgi:hypothetical protein